MFKKWIIAFALSLLSGSAYAACTNPLSIKDGGGSAISMSMSSNADGFCQYNFNMAQINGVAPLMGAGATGTGSPRVTAASDSPEVTVLGATGDAAATVGSAGSLAAKLRLMTSQLDSINTGVGAAVPAGTNLIGKVGIDQTTPGTTNLVALAANQSVNVAQVNGVTTSTGTGAVGTGTQRVAVGTDTATVAGSTPAAAGLGATGSAVPSGAQLAGVLDAAGGTNMLGLAGDPCQTSVKTTVLFTLATAAVKVAITGVSAKKIYVCQYYLNNNAADSVAIFEATTATTCATAAGALIGAGTSVATAAQGNNWAANGGVSIGNGAAQVLSTLTNAADLCIAQSAATQLSGSFTYVTR